MNTHVRDDLAWLYDGENWQAPSFTNSWVNYDTTFYGPAAYRRVGGWVFIEGLIKNGTINTAAFTLPVGYRPLINIVLIAISIDDRARLDVASAGAVQPVTGSNSWFSIEARFPIA